MFKKQLKKSILALSVIGLLCPLSSMGMGNMEDFGLFDIRDGQRGISRVLLLPLHLANEASKQKSTVKPQNISRDLKCLAGIFDILGVPGFLAGFSANAFAHNSDQRLRNNLIALSAGTLLFLLAHKAANWEDIIPLTGFTNLIGYATGSSTGMLARAGYDRYMQPPSDLPPIDQQQIDDETADLLAQKVIDEDLR